MIRRVYDLACQVKQLDTVVVLTDDDRIVDYCSKNEMRCIVVEDDVRSENRPMCESTQQVRR